MTKIGVMLPAYKLDGRVLSIDAIAEYAIAAERLGFDSVWISDHFNGEDNARGGIGGRFDPIVTLAYIAGRTRSVRLGTLVLANVFRSAPQLARELLSLTNIAPGRVTVGLGAGGRPPEYRRFGFAAEHRVPRLRETLEVLPRLLRGESVTYSGESVHLSDASLLGSDCVPPIWVAAFGPQMRRLAADLVDGWNTAWYGPDVDDFVAALKLFREARATSTTKRPCEISVGVRVIPVDGGERDAVGAELDRLRPIPAPPLWESPMTRGAITGSLDEISDTLAAYARAGADHVILNLSLTPTSLLDIKYLDEAAKAVRGTRNE